jgi:hypothetical protein
MTSVLCPFFFSLFFFFAINFLDLVVGVDNGKSKRDRDRTRKRSRKRLGITQKAGNGIVLEISLVHTYNGGYT